MPWLRPTRETMPGALGVRAAPSPAVTAARPSGAAPAAPRSARGSTPSPRLFSAWPRRGSGPAPAAGAVRVARGCGAGRAVGSWESQPRPHLQCELALSLLHNPPPPPFFFSFFPFFFPSSPLSFSLFQLLGRVLQRRELSSRGGKRGGEVGRRGTGAADGSPACRQAQRDSPAGTARGNAAGAPGGVTGGRPRGWPRPARRHWGPAPRAAPRRQRDCSFDSALAARSLGPPSTWGRFYAFVPTLLPPVCLPRVAGCPAASRRPRRGELRAAAASPERRPACTGGETASAGAGEQEGAPCARRDFPAVLWPLLPVTGQGSVPAAVGSRL